MLVLIRSKLCHGSIIVTWRSGYLSECKLRRLWQMLVRINWKEWIQSFSITEKPDITGEGLGAVPNLTKRELCAKIPRIFSLFRRIFLYLKHWVGCWQQVVLVEFAVAGWEQLVLKIRFGYLLIMYTATSIQSLHQKQQCNDFRHLTSFYPGKIKPISCNVLIDLIDVFRNLELETQ